MFVALGFHFLFTFFGHGFANPFAEKLTYC